MYKTKNLLFPSIVFLAIMAFYFISIPYALRINDSESLPYYFFWSIKEKPLSVERGQIVGFTHPLIKHLVAKEAVGLPGDVIKIMDGHVYVNHIDIGKIQKTSFSGCKLTPIREGVIQPGQIFVRGYHERSFDSRYSEVGLVEIANIKELLWPIF